MNVPSKHTRCPFRHFMDEHCFFGWDLSVRSCSMLASTPTSSTAAWSNSHRHRSLGRAQRCKNRAFGKAPPMSPPETASVPATWQEANQVFLSHPSAAVPAAGIALLTLARVQQQPMTLIDLAVGAAVVGLWLVQEWVVHKWLLHSSFDWAGKAIHKEHHEQPYHHVSLDPPALVISVMLLASGVFAVLPGPASPLWLTATAAYWAAGLVYEWLHYIVHTRWVPPAGWRGKWLRVVRRHHMLHHMRNENYWLSFSAPQVDALFGTLPQRSTSVPLTDMARIAHGSAAAAAPKHEATRKTPAGAQLAAAGSVAAVVAAGAGSSAVAARR